MVLQWLTRLASPTLQNADVDTNRSFSGVLFSDQMTGKALECCWHANHRQHTSGNDSRAMLLIHPAQPGGVEAMQKHQFTESFAFFSSPQRQQEWQAMKSLTINKNIERKTSRRYY